MTSQNDKWLRQLAASLQGGVTLTPAITRGAPYSVTLGFGMDMTGGAFVCSLRLAPDAEGATQADFTIAAGAFGGGETPVTLSLTKLQTAALAADGDADGLEELVWDLLYTPAGGTQSRLMGGNIFVSGKVTNAS